MPVISINISNQLDSNWRQHWHREGLHQ